jgi:hypothetical protein
MVELSGLWESTYTYSGGEGRHRLNLIQNGNAVSAQSLKNDDGSTVSMELELNGSVLSGSWGESTSPEGRYEGKFFEGLVVFILNQSGTGAEGLWIGPNRDDTHVNYGSWILNRA